MARVEVIEAIHQSNTISRKGIRWRPVIEANGKQQPETLEMQPRYSSSPESETSLSRSGRPSFSESESLAARVADMLTSTADTGHDFIILGEWLPDLTRRIGNNRALNTAIEALLLSHDNLLKRQGQYNAVQAGVYVKALHALKAEITVEQSGIGADTICAALALCGVEVKAPEGPHWAVVQGADMVQVCQIMSNKDAYHPAWMSHAGGSAALFQACGPEKFKAPFEKSLLFFHAPQFIASCLISRNSCFLNSPQWSAVLEHDTENLGPCDRLQARLVSIYAAFPALLRDMNDLATPDVCNDSLYARAWELRRRLLNLESFVNEVLRREDLVEEVQSEDSYSPYPTCYKYSKLLVAQPLLLYWRLVIIINNTIQRLASRTAASCVLVPEMNAASRRAAQKIAMSAEDGRRRKPIASMIQVFNLPAAIWAFSHSGIEELKESWEARWLFAFMHDHMQTLDSMMKVLIEKYLDAVGLAYRQPAIMPDTTMARQNPAGFQCSISGQG